VSAWQLDVKGETIENCFTKSGVLKSDADNLLDWEVGLGRGDWARPVEERGVRQGQIYKIRRGGRQLLQAASAADLPEEEQLEQDINELTAELVSLQLIS
jgi:hypothetical protein